jgi:hypothetical protein
VAYLTETDELSKEQVAALCEITQELEKKQKGGER